MVSPPSRIGPVTVVELIALEEYGSHPLAQRVLNEPHIVLVVSEREVAALERRADPAHDAVARNYKRYLVAEASKSRRQRPHDIRHPPQS